MQTDKERAEKYVRSKCPELMELSLGCVIEQNGEKEIAGNQELNDKGLIKLADGKYWANYKLLADDEYDGEFDPTIKIIGHPIQLQHWLSAIDTVFGQMKKSGSGTFLNVEVYESPKYEGLSHTTINFNLITGQPATEADYQAFNQIVGI